jgi:hypothetical protein
MMKSKISLREFIVLWLPVILWGAVIFSFSSIQTTQVSEIHWEDFIVKKLAHIVEYAILSFLLYRALKESGVNKKTAGLSAICICFLYGISDEFHQSFTPGREPAFRDVIFDTIGASLAIYSIWNVLPKAPPKLKNLLTNLRVL